MMRQAHPPEDVKRLCEGAHLIDAADDHGLAVAVKRERGQRPHMGSDDVLFAIRQRAKPLGVLQRRLGMGERVQPAVAAVLAPIIEK